MNFDKIIQSLEKSKSKDAKENLKMFKILNEIKKHGNKPESDFKKAFRFLCFNSISYCCGKNKPCINRDAVLDALGVSSMEYTDLKEKWKWEFIQHFMWKVWK